MVTERIGEQGDRSALFTCRVHEVKDQLDEQIRLAKESGNFQDFMNSQLKLLDQGLPGLGGLIREAMDKQQTPEAKEDMFVTLWRFTKGYKVISQEFGVPVQPSNPH